MILLNAPSSLSLAHVRKLIVSALERVVAALAVDALPSAPPSATAAPAPPAALRNSRLVWLVSTESSSRTAVSRRHELRPSARTCPGNGAGCSTAVRNKSRRSRTARGNCASLLFFGRSRNTPPCDRRNGTVTRDGRARGG